MIMARGDLNVATETYATSYDPDFIMRLPVPFCVFGVGRWKVFIEELVEDVDKALCRSREFRINLPHEDRASCSAEDHALCVQHDRLSECGQCDWVLGASRETYERKIARGGRRLQGCSRQNRNCPVGAGLEKGQRERGAARRQ